MIMQSESLIGLTAAIVGCGRMGQIHSKALNSLNINITLLLDPIEENRSQLISNLCQENIPLEFNSVDNIKMDNLPDLFIIATTADFHCEIAIKLIQLGVKYILLEKPLARSIRECYLIREVAKKHKSRIAVNHQMRFMPLYIEPKLNFNKEEFGGFTSMTVNAGNFGLAMCGSHYFEAFRFLTGESIQELTAWLDAKPVNSHRGEKFKDV